MKQKIIALLLALSAVTLSGCAQPDAAAEIETVYLPELTQNEVISPADAEDGAVQAKDITIPEEDPGTTNGDSGTSWDDALTDDEADLDEAGTYNSKEDVSLYLHLYEHLPDNYITKNEARDLGWTGGSVERYAPGCAIGGDRFGNREGLLPDETGRQYYECDIDTIGQSSRGAKRIIFSNDGLIYYTEDHYESFTLLYGEE